MKKRLAATVSGRVQMVMFRDFVTRHAKKIGVVGEVWNEADGTLCVVAEGEEAALHELLLSLHRGPLLAHVEGVIETWEEPTGTFTEFTIRYN